MSYFAILIGVGLLLLVFLAIKDIFKNRNNPKHKKSIYVWILDTIILCVFLFSIMQIIIK